MVTSRQTLVVKADRILNTGNIRNLEHKLRKLSGLWSNLS